MHGLLLAAVWTLLSPGAVDVWIFVRTDCPISNRYAPTIAGLQREYAGRGDVRFLLVYPEPGATAESVAAHAREYGLDAIPVMLDAKLERVRKAGVAVTPEAAVFGDDGKLAYRGRIDDRQASLRIARTPQSPDLANAVAAVLRGQKPAARITKAIGCAIEGK